MLVFKIISQTLCDFIILTRRSTHREHARSRVITVVLLNEDVIYRFLTERMLCVDKQKIFSVTSNLEVLFRCSVALMTPKRTKRVCCFSEIIHN